jgi:hypothetical protein
MGKFRGKGEEEGGREGREGREGVGMGRVWERQ